MSELELEIARTLGASAFLIHQFVKNNPNATSTEIQIETGLSENCVWTNLNKLKSTNVLQFSKKQYSNYKRKVYRENEDRQEWKFH